MSKQALLEIKLKVTKKYYGWPEPFIEDGTLVLMVQNREVKVTEYAAPTDEDPDVWFWDLANKGELISEAEKLIKDCAPEALKAEYIVFFLCPEDLAAKAIKRPRPELD